MLKSKVSITSVGLDLLSDPKKLQKQIELLQKREEANKQALVDLLAGKKLSELKKQVEKDSVQVAKLLAEAEAKVAEADFKLQDAEESILRGKADLADDKDYVEQSKKYLNEFAKQLQEKEQKLDLEAAETLSLRVQLGKEITEAKQLKAEYEDKLKQLQSAVSNFVG